MLTVYMWKGYIGDNTSYAYNTFNNDYFYLFFVIIGTPITICLDLITSPIQALTIGVGKILERKFYKKR